MTTETMITELKAVAEKHKNDFVMTFQTNISAMCKDIIPKLEQLAKYEKIGTIEEITDILQIISEGQDDVDESGISTGLLHTLLEYTQYSKIGTVEECQKARERQRSKKPIKDQYSHDCCPNCGWIVYQNEWGGRYLPHCENCGQAIDWSKLSR